MSKSPTASRCSHIAEKPRNADAHGSHGAEFRFGRMMPRGLFQPMQLKESAAKTIGDLMTADVTETADESDGNIPAGYTYFGQFVDHDITMDTLADPDEADDPATDAIEATDDVVFAAAQGRSPSLDLDSVYGDPFDRDPQLFNGARFRIGRTTAVPSPQFGGGHSGKTLTNDLPRNGVTAETGGPKAAIPDPRNDENLVVAQTHLMWMQFHNNLVGALESADPSADEGLLFAQARALTVKHYQWIVLHDFVRRFIPDKIYKDVIKNHDRRLLDTQPGEVAFMPIEFSVGAYRMGHSMVREAYEWNLNFGSKGSVGDANFRELFRFSGVSGDMAGSPTLPSNWIPDFRRLYDLADYKPSHLGSASTVEAPNFARRFDPFLARALATLPELGGANLAFRNLRRGSLRALPSAQQLAAFASVEPLTVKEMRATLDDKFDGEMQRFGYYERTPLWLYVLIEAAAKEKGLRLGPLGGRIVAETLLTLVMTSRVSIIRHDREWSPKDAKEVTRPVAGRPLTDVANILVWIDGAEPIVNPLEDLRNGAL